MIVTESGCLARAGKNRSRVRYSVVALNERSMVMAGDVGSNGAGGRGRSTSTWSSSAPVSPALYMLHRLRGLGLSATVLEAGDDVGGTWYWNRYPGARCDIPTTDYTYSFDPELENDWTWSEKYATQPEILRYLQHVADRYDLRRDIRFSTRVDAATWDDTASLWHVTHRRRATASRCRWYVMATGCLSVPKEVDIEGADRFQRRGVLHQPLAARGRRPHRQAGRRHRHRLVGHPVDPDHRRAGVRDGGVPAHAELLDPGAATARPAADRLAQIAADREAYRDAASGRAAASRSSTDGRHGRDR